MAKPARSFFIPEVFTAGAEGLGADVEEPAGVGEASGSAGVLQPVSRAKVMTGASTAAAINERTVMGSLCRSAEERVVIATRDEADPGEPSPSRVADGGQKILSPSKPRFR